MEKILVKIKEAKWQSLLLPVLALCSLVFFSSAQALVAGLVMTLVIGNPYAVQLKPVTQKLLAIAIIGLGFGMDLGRVAAVGFHGLHYTLAGLALTFMLSAVLGRLFKTDKNTTTLLFAGTGICGGSAIAAIGPVIKARHEEMAVSLGIVFSLNALLW